MIHSRSGSGTRALLDDFAGILQADGYLLLRLRAGVSGQQHHPHWVALGIMPGRKVR